MPGRAAGLAWGQPSSAAPCTVPARVLTRWLAALPGHGPELALEEPGRAEVWELILGPGLSQYWSAMGSPAGKLFGEMMGLFLAFGAGREQL